MSSTFRSIRLEFPPLMNSVVRFHLLEMMASVLALKVAQKDTVCIKVRQSIVHVHMRGSTISFVWIVFTISACETWPQSFFSNRSFHKWDFQSQLNVYEYDNTYLYYIQLPLQRRHWHWLCKQHHFMIPLNNMVVGNGGVIEFNQII